MDLEKHETSRHVVADGEHDDAASLRGSEDARIPRDPVPLMDLDNGLVGWDSETDPMNPL